MRRLDGHPVLIVPSADYLARLHYRLVKLQRLPMWTIYRPPTEYGLKWVARMFVSLPESKATRFVMTHDTLIELRDVLPPGLACIPRQFGDPPQIVEIWL